MKNFFSTLFILFFFINVTAQTATSPIVKSVGCVEGDCLNSSGKYIFENGDKFNGYWKDGKRND